jgi:hypothetical protein
MPGNRLPLKILEREPEGTQRRGREMDTWSKTELDKPWTDRREDTGDRDRWRNLVLGEGKPL